MFIQQGMIFIRLRGRRMIRSNRMRMRMGVFLFWGMIMILDLMSLMGFHFLKRLESGGVEKVEDGLEITLSILRLIPLGMGLYTDDLYS